MKLRRNLCAVMAAVVLFVVGFTPITVTDKLAENPKEVENENMEKTYSVLFIGNSYTYYNDMPAALFKPFAEAAGCKVEVTAITKGAYRLQQFANPTDEYGAQVEAALTGSKTYDYVILQEHSTRPAGEQAPAFYAAVQNLTERIRKAGASPILYATWGRESGSATLQQHGWTNETMTWKLAAAYEAVGKKLDIPVVHVGLAFFDVYHNTDIDIYDADMTHPSYMGSYLAAATLFAKIFGTDPTTVSYNGSLSQEQANILRQAAEKAVFETPAIPQAYKAEAQKIFG